MPRRCACGCRSRRARGRLPTRRPATHRRRRGLGPSRACRTSSSTGACPCRGAHDPATLLLRHAPGRASADRRLRLNAFRTLAGRYLPGLLASVVVAIAARSLASQYEAPVMLFALLLGMAMNFLSAEGPCKPGIDLAARGVLRIGVALLGTRITLEQIAALGWQPVCWSSPRSSSPSCCRCWWRAPWASTCCSACCPAVRPRSAARPRRWPWRRPCRRIRARSARRCSPSSACPRCRPSR